MKINFQKILLFLCVILVIVFNFCLVVSADESSTLSERELCEAYAYVMNDFKNGDITYTEYQERTNAITAEYYENNTLSDTLEKIENIGNNIAEAVEKYGETAYQYIADWITDFLDDYEVLSEETVTDMNGYGAKMVIYDYFDGNTLVVGNPSYTSTRLTMYYVYGDYITYEPDYEHYNGYLGKYKVPSNQVTYWRPWYNSEFTTHGNSGSHCVGEHTKILVYGDVRYLDGTEAPSLEPSTTTTALNFDNVSDQDLIELINDIYEELERQNPDLSNVEGLLASIYYRLGSLDSDDDNELLSQVLVAIQSLENTNNSELVDLLVEIKDELTNGITGDNSVLAEKLDNMLVKDDFVIDEDSYRNYSEVLKLRLQEKFIFADELKNLVTYTVNSYANSSESPQLDVEFNGKTYSMDFSAYDEHVPMFRFIIAAFTYITYAFHTYRKIPSYINGGDNE